MKALEGRFPWKFPPKVSSLEISMEISSEISIEYSISSEISIEYFMENSVEISVEISMEISLENGPPELSYNMDHVVFLSHHLNSFQYPHLNNLSTLTGSINRKKTFKLFYPRVKKGDG